MAFNGSRRRSRSDFLDVRRRLELSTWQGPSCSHSPKGAWVATRIGNARHTGVRLGMSVAADGLGPTVRSARGLAGPLPVAA